MKVTRREALKTSGLALGGLAVGSKLGAGAAQATSNKQTGVGLTKHNSLFNSLQPCYPQQEALARDEMRITFLGTWYCPRIAQECNSVFVELGNGDSFVFDCGSGVMAKYNALGVPLSRMDKIFLTHLHGDHMSDLTHIFAFGPAFDRKTPLYVWGPTDSLVPDPVTGRTYTDGTKAFCALLREAARWHTESFSFQSTQTLTNPDGSAWNPPPWAPQDKRDGYDLVPFECDWKLGDATDNVVYNYNNVRILSFPAVHARQGAISYKLEWTIGKDAKGDDVVLSMIFTGDTKPNNYVVRKATSGVDVLIHEITTSAEVWTKKFTGLTPADGAAYYAALGNLQRVQDSSHTPEKAFGYILSELEVPVRLAVGTHFPASDDTIREAFDQIRVWYPKGEVTIATDFMVLNVTKKGIRQRRAVVSDYTWAPISSKLYGETFATPKYNDGNGSGDPYAQLDPNADVIPETVYDSK
jgi:ribonuclease Z